MKDKQMSCEQYDYIEIVCMNRYPIKLIMKDTSIIKGIAMNTKVNENRCECIEVSCEGVVSQIELWEISELSVCVENPHFNSVLFG